MRREPNEIEALKANWRRDPIYDLENAEGFEDYREELKEYRLKCEADWKAAAKRDYERLERMVCPIMSIGRDGYGNCQVENCASWNGALDKCGIVVDSYLTGQRVAREER